MVKKLGLAVLAVVLVLCGVIATRPADFTITRSAVVAAPAEVVFPYANDFHKWVDWSPWDKMDPAQERKHSGAPSGVGAVYEWKGKEVGQGRMTLTESVPAQKVGIRLEFIEPMPADYRVAFTLAPAAGGTQVTWTMAGTYDFMGKAMGLVMDMDAMVGKDFEAGLASLKGLAEAEAKRQQDAARAAAEAAAKAAAEQPAVAAPATP